MRTPPEWEFASNGELDVDLKNKGRQLAPFVIQPGDYGYAE
jgi:hypothetical protein